VLRCVVDLISTFQQPRITEKVALF